MPSIIPCDQASISEKRDVGQPGDRLEALARQRQRELRQQVGAPCPARSRRECDPHAPGIRRANAPAPPSATRRERRSLRSAMCASPSLRIMLWPISRVIRPAGWSEENTSMRFSETKMSSRRVSNVEPSCGTKAIGASRRIARERRIGIAPEVRRRRSRNAGRCSSRPHPVLQGRAILPRIRRPVLRGRSACSIRL